MSTYSKRIRFLIGNGIFVHQSSLDRCVMPVVMLTLRVRSSVTVKDKTKVFNLTFLINLNIPFGITRSQFLMRNTQHGKSGTYADVLVGRDTLSESVRPELRLASSESRRETGL